MNHLPQFHIDRLAHDHHDQLISDAAVRRTARHDVRRAETTRRSPVGRRVPRPRVIASIGVAIAGLLAAIGGGTADAGTLARSAAAVEAPHSTELSFGPYLRAV